MASPLSSVPAANPTPRWLATLRRHTSRSEKILLLGLVLSLIVSAFLIFLGLLDRWTYLTPEQGGIYHEAAVGQPHSLNPILTSSNDIDNDIIQLVYSSLFKLDANLVPQPELAESFTLSDDKREYTIKLKRDIVWHDGEAFTADDVIFTLNSIQTPDYNSPLVSQFQGVEVTKQDDYTVHLKLREPYTPFLVNLTTKIIPQHVWANIAPRNAALAEQNLKPVGTGPFQFSKLTTRRKTGEITNLRLTRFDRYYDTAPYLDGLEFSFFNSHDETVNALRSGRVDGLGFLPLQLLEQVDSSAYNLRQLLLPQYFALFFNQNQNTLLRDAGLRNALLLATDRESLVDEALDGQAEPLQVPLPHGLLGHRTDLASSYDPEAAKQNLEEAGWRDVDGDGIREKDNTRLTLKITTTDWPEYVRTAEIIQKQWQKIGVETVIEHFGAGTIQQTIVGPRQYEILLFGEILPADPDPYPFWHSTQTKSPGLNLALLQDKTVDDLLETARQAADPAARAQKYQDFQGRIFELNPAIILYQPYYLFVTRDKVRGPALEQAALPAQRFNDIHLWHVRTQRIWK
jgi:peptide/nickel transport system substrate-binding protein